jgi:hypothetical protein
MPDAYAEFRVQIEKQGHTNLADLDDAAGRSGTSVKAVHAEMVRLGIQIPWAQIGAFMLCVFMNCLHQSLPEAVMNCAGVKKPDPKP